MACKTAFLLVAACMGVTALHRDLQSPLDDCVVDSENPCKAVCGDLKLDISDVFAYPVSVRDAEYQYVYSPCNGTPCYTPAAAICQFLVADNSSWTCGDIIEVTWTLLKMTPLQFSVVYDGGDDGRQSIVTFNEDPTMTKAELFFTGENPSTTYNFAIRGNYVGQQPDGSKCTVDESNSCVATCNGQKFDISNVFNYPTRAIGGNYTYSYSPCGGSMCKGGSSSNSALCQTSLDNESGYSLGSVSSIEWWLNQTAPYVFVIKYKDGDDGRTSQVKFTEDDKLQSSTFAYLGEPIQLGYNFEVRGSNVGQPSDGPGACSVDPNNNCALLCDGKVAVDISDVFRYPVSSSDRGYTFDYNPCNGGSCGCPDRTTNNAVCQIPNEATQFTYGCGKVSDVQWTVKRTHPYIFSISYSSGDEESCDGNPGDKSRKSEVTFYEDAAVPTPNMKYVGENPELEYNFEVRGSYVGQKANRTSCVVDASTPCIATCNKTVKIDLSKVISNPITIPGPGGANFIYSPCVGYTCGSPAKNSSVCLGDHTSYGQLSTVKWTLTQTKPFYVFTVTYTGGDEDNNGTNPRSSTFTFVESTGVDRIVAVYVGELADNSNSYLFDVVGSCIGQPACSGIEDHTGLFVLHAGLLVTFACVFVLMAVVAIVAVGISYRSKRNIERKDAYLLN